MGKAERPVKSPSVTERVRTGCGNMYVTMTFQKGNPMEVFGMLGKSGTCARSYAAAMTRCVSIGLRYGIPIDEFIHQLSDIRCPAQIWADGEHVKSCPDAVALGVKQILERIESNDELRRHITEEHSDNSGTSRSVSSPP